MEETLDIQIKLPIGCDVIIFTYATFNAFYTFKPKGFWAQKG